jgi:hypothetical protein
MSLGFETAFTEEISEPIPEGIGVTIDDFVAYMPSHTYIFMPCCEIWTAASVNSRCAPMPVLNKNGKPRRGRDGKPMKISASKWLDRNRPVEQKAWCPGQAKLIHDRLVVDGGWIERKEVTVFNLYRPPLLKHGDAAAAEPWIDHMYKIFNQDDASHVIKWLAHRVQRPGEKINHGLVLGSNDQGVGKDTLLDPIRHAVGPWNFHDITPTQLLGRFNDFVKSVVLRVNEARDLGDVDRFKFYDHSKMYTASPPEVVRVDEKHLREHYVVNCLGFIITTNHRDGLFLPAEDRRHYVAWSKLRKEDFAPGYWDKIWKWYDDGGRGQVAAYLDGLDLSGFDPKAPPPKTPAFWDIVHISAAPEDAELSDVIEKLGDPDALTIAQLAAVAPAVTAEWLKERKNRRVIPHRLGRCGYVSVQNPERDDGRWKIGDTKQTIYAKLVLSPGAQQQAARKLREDSSSS